jgi:hypothetical protein
VSYASYIAPALLGSSAMNGALNETMNNVFWKLRYEKTYDSILATPLGSTGVAVGETAWDLARAPAHGRHAPHLTPQRSGRSWIRTRDLRLIRAAL